MRNAAEESASVIVWIVSNIGFILLGIAALGIIIMIVAAAGLMLSVVSFIYGLYLLVA